MNETTHRPWMSHGGAIRRVGDLLVILAGIAVVVAVCLATIDSAWSRVIWIPLASFYFLFYRRIAYVIYWSWSTMSLLRREAANPQPAPVCPEEALPYFHILIAANGAGDSIRPAVLLPSMRPISTPRKYSSLVINCMRQAAFSVPFTAAM